MTALAVAAPATMSALCALLAGAGARLHFIAGGTDMLVTGRPLPDEGVLVDLSGVRGMAFIDTRSTDIRIGGATTIAALAGHAGLGARLAALGQAAGQFGSMQIRNRATIGGNVANAAPAADLMPVLLAAHARLLVVEPGGRQREVPLAGHEIRQGELIAEVVLPDGGASASAFVKLGLRSDLAIARLSLALVADFERGRFEAVRLAAGAIGAAARRLPLAEEALSGRRLDAAVLRGFVEALAAEVDAAIPGRPSHPWKRRAVAGLGLDLIARFAGMSPRGPMFEEALQ